MGIAGELHRPASGIRPDAVTLLGSDQPLTWSQDESGLTIETPPDKPCDHAWTFRIALKDSQ